MTSEVKPPMSAAVQVPPPMQQKPIPGVQTYAFALSPDARAELSLKGTITADDLEMLRDHIELTIKALARSAKGTQQSCSGKRRLIVRLNLFLSSPSFFLTSGAHRRRLTQEKRIKRLDLRRA